MAQMLWSPCPPEYLRRWAVQGVKPEGGWATTIFDLRKDREHVAVYPATVDTFAMLIDHTGVQTLLTAIESRNACTVPGTHAIHGHRLIGLRPCDAPHAERPWIDHPADAPSYQGPMELYVHLPNKQQIHILYGRQGLTAVHDALTKILNLMH
jgi:hypothetical protein